MQALREALVDLDFTASEADAYLTLARSRPMTAYAVAKAASLDKANTYKALESLAAKGAVDVADGERRIWAAVPPCELIALLRERRMRALDRAADAAAALSPTPADKRVYEVKSVDGVYRRATEMLGRARLAVAIDAFPGPLERLLPALEAAAARGVTVSVRRYGSPPLRGVHSFDAEHHAAILDRWHGEWFTLAVDAREVLIAYLARGGTAVHQCAYSASQVLAMVVQNGVVGETLLGELRRRHQAGEDPRSIVGDLAAVADEIDPLDLPGRVDLGGEVS